ncbi:MAG TPA: TetR family transcriptional regulator [Clostridiales bacterium]|nr:TetR family transcriptional regulator [Clostridiales bacterium]
MRSDRRVRYTKQLIKDMFLELLLEKPSHKITVKELCERADINRTTFYSHYEGIYSLAEELEMESIAEIKQRLLQYSIDGNNNTTLYFVKILQENHPYSNKYIFCNDNSKYFTRLFSECKDLILSHWITRQSKMTPAQQEWLYTFLASGCTGVLRTWVMGGMKESAEEVADFINQLIACYDTFLKVNG